jgi:hypothetical protein
MQYLTIYLETGKGEKPTLKYREGKSKEKTKLRSSLDNCDSHTNVQRP